MNGLQGILFGIFIFIVLLNLLIRFVVKKLKKEPELKGEQQSNDIKRASSDIPLTVREGEETFVHPMYRKEKEILIQEDEDALVSEMPDILDLGEVRQRIGRQYLTEQDQKISDKKKEPSSPLPLTESPEMVSQLEEELDTERKRYTKKWKEASIKELSGTIEEREIREEERVSSWDRIGGLSPLKRAVIFSEILGKPKGL